MGKYSNYSSDRNVIAPQKTIHPVWRGIGCVMMVLIPGMAFAGALLILQENAKNVWFKIPSDLLVKEFSDPLILIKAIFTFVIALFLYFLFAMVTFIINRFFGPPRYGPTDMPMPRKKNVHKSR